MLSLVKEIIKLAVPEYILVGLVGVLTGFVFSNEIFPVYTQLLLGIICVALTIAGYNSFNAISDKEIDKINKPNRPLARRALTESEALYASLIFFVLAIIIGYVVNLTFLIIIVITTTLAILYSLPGINLKKRFVFGTLSANVLYTVLFPLAGWAIQTSNQIPTYLIVYLFIFGIGIATLKDFEDIRGDSKYGVRTPLNYMGYSQTLIFVSVCFVISVLVLSYLVLVGLIAFKYILVSLLTLPALFNIYILYKDRSIKQGAKAFIRGLVILVLVEGMFILLSI